MHGSMHAPCTWQDFASTVDAHWDICGEADMRETSFWGTLTLLNITSDGARSEEYRVRSVRIQADTMPASSWHKPVQWIKEYYNICICNKISLHHHNNHALHLPLIKWGKAFADNTAWTFSDVPEKRRLMYSLYCWIIAPTIPWAKLPSVMTASLISSLLEFPSDTRLTNLSIHRTGSHATQRIKESLNNFFSDAHLGITPSNLNDDFLVWFPMMEFLIFLKKWQSTENYIFCSIRAEECTTLLKLAWWAGLERRDHQRALERSPGSWRGKVNMK